MKKLLLLIICLFPLSVFAYTGPLDDEFFTINNQTTSPFNITISGNGSTDVTFKLDYFYNHNISNYDIPGSYLFFSIESNKKLSIKRKYNFGSNCSTSCFSNDDYLMLNSDSNGYSYVYYFNIVKWARIIGTQIDQFSVSDIFTFHNLESGTATVYIYGSYANNTNEIPSLIQNVETKQQIIIGNESIESTLNKNTQEIIESSMICRDIDVKDVKIQDKMLYNNGQIGENGFYSITDYFTIYPTSKLRMTTTFNYQSNTELCFYDINKSLISCLLNTSLVQNQYITIPNNTNFVRFSLRDTNNEPQFKLCNNGNQENNQSINDINDNITSNDIDNPNSDFSDMEDMIAHNGVITNLIALPITLYTSILNGLNQNCSEYNFGQLFGSDLKFHCINLGALLGNTIWGVIDVLFSGFTIYAIAKKMIKVFNNFSGLQEGDVIDD